MAGTLPYDPTRPLPVNWGAVIQQQFPQAADAWFNTPTKDVAAENKAAMKSDAETAAAAAKAAAAGIQNQKDEEAADAMAGRYRLAPEDERIKRSLKTADALRSYGHSLNTGSVNGSAPNWAGALADALGGYMAGKREKQAAADAEALGGKYADIAGQYFRNAPKDYF